MKHGIRTTGLKAALFLLAGCVAAPINTLDSLTVSSANDGSYVRPVNLKYPLQTRILSINGQLPVPGAGSGCLASSRRSANSIICFSDTDQKTQVLVKDYAFAGGSGNESAESVLNDIRSKLQALQVDVTALVREKSEQVRLARACARGTESACGREQGAAASTQKRAQEVEQAARALTERSLERNVFIFQWEASSDANASGSLGNTASASASSSGNQRGYVIVAGLRVSQLLLSRDAGAFDEKFGDMPDGTKIATLTMAADHMLYFAYSDRALAAGAGLDASLQDLQEVLGPQERVAIEAALAIGSAQGNEGLFSGARIAREPFPNAVNDEKQIFYSVFTDVESLRKNYRSR